MTTPGNKQNPCPPGKIRPMPALPCQPKPFLPMPTGGPATGVFGGTTPSAAPASSTPESGPTPPPPVVCMDANTFADCFAACAGVIPPGSVCGWRFSQAFGIMGGQVTLSPGQMALQVQALGDFPGAYATIPVPFSSINSVVAQYKFTEFSIPFGGGAFYEFFLVTSSGNSAINVHLDDMGGVQVTLGVVAGLGTFYTGNWTPSNSTHVVHFTHAVTVPRLWIDGVEIFLTNMGAASPVIGTLAANSISFFGSAGPASPDEALILDAFVNVGNAGLPPTTEFCCP